MTKRLTTEALEAIRKRAEAATEGPWRRSNYAVYGGTRGYALVDAPTAGDAEFIAHSREDIPTLLAEVERLREGLSYIAESYWEFDSPDKLGEIAEAYLNGREDE